MTLNKYIRWLDPFYCALCLVILAACSITPAKGVVDSAVIEPRAQLTDIYPERRITCPPDSESAQPSSSTRSKAGNASFVKTGFLPEKTHIAENYKFDDPEILRGVFVDDLFALRVLQQEGRGTVYVSDQANSVTQFGLAEKYGNTGLLAHNYLSGKLFFDLEIGQSVSLVYGNGCLEAFTVTEILKYQALLPDDPYGDLRDLSNGEIISSSRVFDYAYKGDRHLTFQTCIEAEGNPSWGRIFVIAEPIAELFQAGRIEDRK